MPTWRRVPVHEEGVGAAVCLTHSCPRASSRRLAAAVAWMPKPLRRFAALPCHGGRRLSPEPRTSGCCSLQRRRESGAAPQALAAKAPAWPAQLTGTDLPQGTGAARREGEGGSSPKSPPIPCCAGRCGLPDAHITTAHGAWPVVMNAVARCDFGGGYARAWRVTRSVVAAPPLAVQLRPACDGAGVGAVMARGGPRASWLPPASAAAATARRWRRGSGVGSSLGDGGAPPSAACSRRPPHLVPGSLLGRCRGQRGGAHRGGAGGIALRPSSGFGDPGAAAVLDALDSVTVNVQGARTLVTALGQVRGMPALAAAAVQRCKVLVACVACRLAPASTACPRGSRCRWPLPIPSPPAPTASPTPRPFGARRRPCPVRPALRSQQVGISGELAPSARPASCEQVRTVAKQ